MSRRAEGASQKLPAAAAASAATAAGALVFAQPKARLVAAPLAVAVDFAGPRTALPHFWEAAGSDRAIVGLRDQWRSDLIAIQQGMVLDRFVDEEGRHLA